jgi:hypothetical protein
MIKFTLIAIFMLLLNSCSQDRNNKEIGDLILFNSKNNKKILIGSIYLRGEKIVLVNENKRN